MAAHSQLTVAAILVAAGSGERLGADVPKAFVQLGGATVLEQATRRFAAHPLVDRIVVVVPASHLDEAGRLISAIVVAGGATRQASVASGLAAIGADVDYVLVHDVARPLVPDRVIDAVLGALRAGADAVVPVVPIADTVRSVTPDGTLAGVVDRSTLRAVQTPQGFRREVLTAAHQQAGSIPTTDDASLVEALGREVVAVPGADEAFKITTAADLVRAELVLGGTS
jgi:2-C-methyl-D-erythritol 4-phosphate cytidylyltransferase